MVEKINGGQQDSPHNKITLKNTKTNKKTTYLIPLGKIVTIGRTDYDMSKVKNGELIITGENTKDSNFNLVGLALEHMDTDKNGKIDEDDFDLDMATKFNKEILKDSKYYVKQVDFFSDAGMYEGEGGVSYRKRENDELFEVFIENKQ